MKCPYCNANQEDNASFCSTCGKSLVPAPAPQAVYSNSAAQGERPMFHNTSAVVSLIFSLFCAGWVGVIFAVVGLVKGSRVDALWAMGDVQGAASAAAEGNKYVKIAWIINVVLLVVTVLSAILALVFFGGLAALANI